MTAVFSSRAVILHLTNYGDSHRLVEVLTPEHGRLTLLARGARASKKRFAGLLDVFATVQAHIQSARGMLSLQAAEAVASRLGIRRDLKAILRASGLCNCVRLLAPVQQEATAMAKGLEGALDLLDHLAVSQAATGYLELLRVAGILAGPEALPNARLRAVARGEQAITPLLADELEVWARAWVTHYTGTAWPQVGGDLA